jgi:hypothetical protein
MTTPTITELPLRLESTAADSFLDRAVVAPVLRELDRRRRDGIDVRLLWNQSDDHVVVAVFDAKTGDAFELEVEGRDALDAFHHPYAHAAFLGVDHHAATGHRHIAGAD